MYIKIAVSTIVVALELFVWGAVVFVFLMKDYYAKHFGHIFRPPSEMKMWGLIIEKILQGLLLSVLYLFVEPFVASPVLNGLIFGALVGGLLEITYFFSTWVNYRVEFAPVFVNTVFGFFRMLLAGLLIGIILK